MTSQFFMYCALRKTLCTTSSVSERGDMDSENHCVVIWSIGSHSVKSTLSRLITLICIKIVIIIDHEFLIGIYNLTISYQLYELDDIYFLSSIVKLVPLRKKKYTTQSATSVYAQKENQNLVRFKIDCSKFTVCKIICIYPDDLSKNKVATQSTTAPSNTDSYRAGNAVDRDITTCMRTDTIGVNSPDKTVWWKVDLGGVYSIYSVNILFKNYDGYGMY